MGLASLLRPRQWLKNTFIFVPVVFSGHLFEEQVAVAALISFVAFCAVSSSVYAVNDIVDAEVDRKHPTKRFRPVAAGRISPTRAMGASILLAVLSAGLAWLVSGWVLLAILAYVVNNLAYSFFLRRVPILDVMSIAFGYILRMLVGSVVSTVPASDWILLTTFFLTLFVAIGKRRGEISFLENEGRDYRPALRYYSGPMLDQALASLMAMSIVCYSLFAASDYALRRFGTDALIYTVPFVVYGALRYFQLIHLDDKGDSPTDVLLTDRPLWLCIVLWGVTCLVIIYGKKGGLF